MLVHSNNISCRKRGRLGLDPVLKCNDQSTALYQLTSIRGDLSYDERVENYCRMIMDGILHDKVKYLTKRDQGGFLQTYEEEDNTGESVIEVQ